MKYFCFRKLPFWNYVCYKTLQLFCKPLFLLGSGLYFDLTIFNNTENTGKQKFPLYKKKSPSIIINVD